MKIALAQLNPRVGDVIGNCEQLKRAVLQAIDCGADLVVTPELFISGYPPKDLLLREGFVSACDEWLASFAGEFPSDIGLIVGHPTRIGLIGSQIANAATLIADGKIQATIHKALLPNYDVFDERRYFTAASSVFPVEFRGHLLGIHICEDAWWGEPSTDYHTQPELTDPVARLVSAGADVLINLSASPFEITKPDRRRGIISRHVEKHGVPFVFVNQVGGNDDLVFDGQSLSLSGSGATIACLAAFEGDFAVVDLGEPELAKSLADAHGDSPQQTDQVRKVHAHSAESRESNLLNALILGLRDYIGKSGFTDCVLGLSGGIDSALACYIAARAVGSDHVHGLLMPSRYSSDHSVDDARQLAVNLGVPHDIIPIDDVHRAFESTTRIDEDLTSQPAGIADQNLQARIRGAMVMVRSNRHGWLPLATGNKSELAVGYCTLYGDMAGGFAVLSDVFKRDVYAMSRYINEVRDGREVIPNAIIDKAPSAELAPDQFDEDTLPPYPILDGILEGLIEREASIATLCREFPAETVRWVAARLDRNEFKRRQMPPGIKLTARAFGSGRRMPMAACFDAIPSPLDTNPTED